VNVKKTALYDIHKQTGAKLVKFAGFSMPIQYKGMMNIYGCELPWEFLMLLTWGNSKFQDHEQKNLFIT